MAETVNLEDSPEEMEASPSTLDMLRMKQQMSNQCFEMAVHLNTGRNKRTVSITEAEKDLPGFINDLEKFKTVQFNSTLVLHRMQMSHAVGEKMKQSDPEAAELTALSDRSMALCSKIKQIQQESRYLQDEIVELQKKRLDTKRLTHEKMKEMEDLVSKKEHPDAETYKAALEKGQANLEKYKKMAILAQNVLRGIMLACKINWLNDPKLHEIAMTLEELPIDD